MTPCACAIKFAYHTTLKAMLGLLVYGCDMLLPINFNADWALRERQKRLSTNDSDREGNNKEFNMNKYFLQYPGIYIRSLHHIVAPMRSKEF